MRIITEITKSNRDAFYQTEYELKQTIEAYLLLIKNHGLSHDDAIGVLAMDHITEPQQQGVNHAN